MISYLKGNVLKKTDKGIILDTGNVGYYVHTTKNYLAKVEERKNAEFFIHSHIREDAFDLYGFAAYEEYELFKKLINVNGIGPKVGMEISNIETAKIEQAILNEDIEFICKIPGIGKKIAQRIILELRGKIGAEPKEASLQDIDEDVFNALTKLGFNRHQINNGLKKAPKDLTKAEDLITYFLKNA